MFQFTPQAYADLFEIWDHIALDSAEAADSVEEAIYQACYLSAQVPLSRRTRSDITSLPLRFLTLQRYPNYIIVYDPVPVPIRVIRILHAKRDLNRILREP